MQFCLFDNKRDRVRHDGPEQYHVQPSLLPWCNRDSNSRWSRGRRHRCIFSDQRLSSFEATKETLRTAQKIIAEERSLLKHGSGLSLVDYLSRLIDLNALMT